MIDREVVIPEAAGKTIDLLRFMLSAQGDTEVQIEFTDGTSFSSNISPRTQFDGELYIGGVGEPQILKRYGDV